MERKELPDLPQKLTLENRSRLTVTGVQDVESFDESAVVLHTNRGVLVIRGRNCTSNSFPWRAGRWP